MTEMANNPAGTVTLLRPVLDDLSTVIGNIRDDQLGDTTPCAAYDVRDLLGHTIGWLENFAAAFASADGRAPTNDAGLPTIPLAEAPARVQTASQLIAGAVADGGADRRVFVASPEGMPGDALLLMLLGEYIAHGWDLARATGQPWSVDDAAISAARGLLEDMVQPEYRGGEHGMFAEEVAVSPSASALDRYLGFTGRDPGWAAG